jgi:O-antigen/teichoic acid export membrane protein
MQTVYSIVYVLIFVFSVFIMPFISALYESDEEDSLLKRILYSAAYAFAITAVWCAVIFISFIWLSKYTTASGTTGQISAPFYMMECLSIIGWILLSLNGGIGLVFLPFLLIKDFVNRPTKLSS